MSQNKSIMKRTSYEILCQVLKCTKIEIVWLKGTLYDNILGKSRRMKALEEVGLSSSQELAVLEYCCEISSMPYNRRTSRSLKTILDFVENMAAVKLTGLLTHLLFLNVKTSARVSLLRVEIENETSQGNFWESRMRMRVLGEKLRVENENESSEQGCIAANSLVEVDN